MKRFSPLFSLSLVFALACGGSSSNVCGPDGESFSDDVGAYCAYIVVRGGFTCPPGFEHRIDLPDGSLVCADRPATPEELPLDLCTHLGIGSAEGCGAGGSDGGAGDAGDAGPVDGGALSCMQADVAVEGALAAALAERASCTVDADCELVAPAVVCDGGARFNPCPVAVPTGDASALDDAVAAVEGSVCPRAPADCVASGSCLEQAARCLSGTCRAVDPACTSRRVVGVTATAMSLLDEAPIHFRRKMRVQVEIPLRECEGFAPMVVSVDADTREVQLSSKVWVTEGVPCAASATATRAVSVQLPSDAEGTWTVLDASPSATESFTVDVVLPPAGTCGSSPSACVFDCDCVAGEICAGHLDEAGLPAQTCIRPCEVDRDCAGGTCVSLDDGPQLHCDAGPECDAGRPCPEAFGCNDGTCEPTFTPIAAAGPECFCDSECGEGLACVQATDGTLPGRCEARCRSNYGGGSLDGTFWCAAAWACGGLGFEPPRVEDVCVFIGE